MSNPERKWFVYTGVQQEGPLSLDEVRSRAASGRLIGAHLAWCEGMETWLKVDEIETLRTILYPPRPAAPMPPPIPQQYPTQNHQPQAPMQPQAPAQPQYQNPFLSQPQQPQQPQPQPQAPQQHPYQQQHHFQPQHHPQMQPQHPPQAQQPQHPQQPQPQHPLQPQQPQQPQGAPVNPFLQPSPLPRQPLAEQPRISPLTQEAPPQQPQQPHPAPQAPTHSPFTTQTPAPTIFLNTSMGPLAPSTPLVRTAPMPPVTPQAPAAPAAPFAPFAPAAPVAPAAPFAPTAPFAPAASHSSGLPGAEHALPAQSGYQPAQPLWTGSAQPAAKPENTITGLLESQLRMEEPETDLTPQGLSVEDDNTNSLNMNIAEVYKESDEPEAEPERELEARITREIETEPEPDNKEEDLSALIYMKLDRLEEKTGLIDGRALKKAEKEAAKAAKISRKATKTFEDQVVKEEVGRARRWLMGAGLLGLGGLIGTGLGYGYQWLAMNQHWFRGLPETPGVRLDERGELQDVISTSLGDAVRVSVAISQTVGESPSFWVTSNLPDGAIFDVFLHGDPDTLIGAQRFDAVLHVKLAEGAGRTDLARGPDGARPPSGKYIVVAVEADLMGQPEAVRAALQDAKKSGTRLPPWVPGDRRVAAVRTYTLLMGKSSSAYETELKEARGQRAKAYLDRFKTLGGFQEKLNGAMNSFRDSLSIAQTGNAQSLPDARKRWDAFDQDLKPKFEEFERQANAVQSQDLLQLMPLFKQAWKGIAQAHGLTIGGPSVDGIEKNLSDASNQLNELRTRIEKAEAIAQAPLVLTQEAPVVPSGPAAAPVPVAAPATAPAQPQSPPAGKGKP